MALKFLYDSEELSKRERFIESLISGVVVGIPVYFSYRYFSADSEMSALDWVYTAGITFPFAFLNTLRDARLREDYRSGKLSEELKAFWNYNPITKLVDEERMKRRTYKGDF